MYYNANVFLFAKKNKNNESKEIKENKSYKNIFNKTFTYALNNNNIKPLKKCYNLKKQIFSKTERESAFKKAKISGALLKNKFFAFKKFLKKQNDKNQKILYDIKKAQSMELKNIQLGLIFLKKKEKNYQYENEMMKKFY